jgi:hypothetical protein
MAHAHPVQWSTAEEKTGGPLVAFHGTFPAPGRWRLWAQFKRHGRIVMSEFTVDVKEPLLPATTIRWLLGD